MEWYKLGYHRMKYDNIIKELETRIKKLEKNSCITEHESYKDFPEIGITKHLYVDITNNTLYRWDSKEDKYIAFVTKHHSQDHLINAVEVTEDVLSVVCPIAGTAMSIGEKVVEELEEHIHKK